MKTVTPKQPAEVLDYDIDYDDWFSTRPGDEVASVVVSFTGDDAALIIGPTGGLNAPTILPGTDDGIAGHRVKLRIGGGTSGVTYQVTVLATCSSGEKPETDFRLPVRAQ